MAKGRLTPAKILRNNTGPDPNGTYLSFAGWPYLRASSLAIARGLVSSEYGFGRRLMALGS
ncbi:MAG: hypothetical protein OEV99_01630, partial [Nitrospira sp.]|nr:hypothetical protein [Nitrospira sp.]MDH4368516.1 hypothetical protein [Nitrospira sp.]MDH5348015.1 hypothetical protein [Nitrospira sp.]